MPKFYFKVEEIHHTVHEVEATSIEEAEKFLREGESDEISPCMFDRVEDFKLITPKQAAHYLN